MRSVSEYTQLVEERIAALLLPGDDLAGLYEPISYGLAGGGKRLRPVLLLMTVEAMGGDVIRGYMPAVGIEMFHNFTLLHDDVMDCSDLRRGRPTVVRKWNLNTAILSGDTMLTLATEHVMNVDDSVLRDVMNLFNRMAIDVYEGQQRDMDFEVRSDVTLEQYLEMIRQKTGALLGAAAGIGALVGGGTDEDARRLYEFGELLGIAFQIQDDYLDVFGDPATFGKPIGGDIVNNKKTFLMLKAMEGSEEERRAMTAAMSLSDSDEKIAAVRRVYEEMGLPGLCERQIAWYSSQALKALEGTNVTPEGLNALTHLTESLVSRKK